MGKRYITKQIGYYKFILITMQTSLYEITFKDGRVFRVFNANAKQFDRFMTTYGSIKDKCTPILVKNGIHTIKEWEEILSKEVNEYN